MNNRVDYLSDRLVNLRGKHKSVDEVIPPDSIANGVSIKAPSPAEEANSASANRSVAKSAPNQAHERRREQTWQLGNDLEQRMLKRKKQIELRLAMLAEQSASLQETSERLNAYCQELKAVKLDSDCDVSASELGERYRAIDKLRLNFFDVDAQLEMLMSVPSAAANTAAQEQITEPESFKYMLKKGLAWALTAGMVIAAAILLAAAIIFSAWN